MSARIPWLVVLALAAVFTTLKLTHVTDWSWWWVLSPLWIAALIVIAAVVFALAALAAMNSMEG